MDYNYRSRPGSQQGTNCIRGKILAFAVHIGEHGHRPAHGYAASRGHKSSACRYDLISWTDAEGVESKFKSYGSIGDGDGVLNAKTFRELALEKPALLSRPIVQAAGAHDVNHCAYLLSVRVRPWRKRFRADRIPAIHG